MKLINFILIGYFSLGACLPKSDLSQLLKLKELIAHYELHKIEADDSCEDFGFIEFLYIHFLDVEEHEEDHTDEHDELPFQQFSSIYSSFIADCCHEMEMLELPLIQTPYASSDQQLYCSGYSSAPFQPPIS